MSFDYPFVLLALLALPAFVLSALHSRRKGRSGSPLHLIPWRGALNASVPYAHAALYALSSLAAALGWCCLVIAASGPARIERVERGRRVEASILFAVDVSPSMAAMDIEPNRLEGAVRTLRAALADGSAARGASLGLVAFGASAALVCPPTPDYAAFEESLMGLKPGMLGDGTAVGQGLGLALRHVRTGGGAKAVVLITDGEDNAGVVHPLDAASQYRRYGVELAVMGVGSKGEAPIAYSDPRTGERFVGTYKSAFSDAALAAIAREAGGSYAAAVDAGALESALGQALASTGPSLELPPAKNSRTVPLGAPFLAAGLAALALCWLVRSLFLGGVL